MGTQVQPPIQTASVVTAAVYGHRREIAPASTDLWLTVKRSVVVAGLVVALGAACASPKSRASTPAIGPHRGTIVFSVPVDGPWPIMAVNGDGTDQRLLVAPSAGLCNGYDVAPDGTRLVFACSDLTIVDISSGARHNIATFAPDTGADPVWSPDGRQIAMRVSVSDRTPMPSANGPSESQAPAPPHPQPEWSLVILNADGTGRHTISDDAGTVQWTPDSKQIVFSDSSGVWVINTDGTGRKPAGSVRSPTNGFVWSPDRTHVAFVQSGAVMVGAGDGTGVHKLVDGHLFMWSPDSHRLLVFAAIPGNDSQAAPFLINVDGSGRASLQGPGQRPSLAVGQERICAAWSPDGTEVALTPGDIWTIRVADKVATKLTNGLTDGASCPLHWVP